MSETVTIECNAEETALVTRTIEILSRTLEGRHGVGPATGARPGMRLELAIHDGLGAEGYSIGDVDSGIRITGNDERGLLYGVGRFLRECRSDGGSFVPCKWRGTSVPAKPVRGMYFASHFHNFYHDAPLAEVQRYVEELALWGCNALSVWFDMHHFSGINDPDASAMIDRLRAVLETANSVGISAGLTTLANEAYASSPEDLRADWTAGHDGYTSPPGGHYHVEICPNKAGGLDQITNDRREMLQRFADLDIAYVWIWPYDQGGCTCSHCAPWGANGFLTAAETEAAAVREVMPSAKIILSTWYFDHFTTGEWEGLSRAFAAEKPDWVDYLLIDDYGSFPDYPLERGVPGGFPVVNFPEISMEGMCPWGGFGANPRPGRWQVHWDKTRQLVAGGFPYSEGIYEDINKITLLQLEWSPDRPAIDIVREYAASEFGAVVADEVVTLVQALEAAHGQCLSWDLAEWPGTRETFSLFNTVADRASETFRLARDVDARMQAGLRASWRWRILYLRAELDAELTASGGKPTPVTEGCFEELCAIYHADRALLHVSPPGTRTLERIAAVGLEQT